MQYRQEQQPKHIQLPNGEKKYEEERETGFFGQRLYALLYYPNLRAVFKTLHLVAQAIKII